jgi:hypothetical protein
MGARCLHESCTSAGCWITRAIRTAKRYVKRDRSGRVAVDELRMARPWLVRIFQTNFSDAAIARRVSL